MTVPLCDTEGAEQTAEQCVTKAFEYDSQNIDALQQRANLRIMRAKDDEAFECLKKVVEIIKSKDQQDLPSLDFRLQTACLLIELSAWKQAVRILDTIIKEDDSDPQVWYNLAFCQFQLQKYQNSKECLKNIQSKGVDPEILIAKQELLEKIQTDGGVDSTQEEDQVMPGQGDLPDPDNDEVIPEEDISDDEVEMVD